MSVCFQDSFSSSDSKTIKLQKGVRQGDVISTKLFTDALEDVFKLLDWDGFGININGEYIIYDIVIMTDTIDTEP